MSYLDLLIKAFQYDFIRDAMLVGVLVAISCALLGTFLVLRKLSLIGDGLAHVSFAGVAVAMLTAQSPLIVGIILVSLASVLILKLHEKTNIHGDAAIGLVSSLSIAAGVIMTSLSGGYNADLFSYLFGSLLVISKMDLVLSVLLAIGIVIVVIWLYPQWFALTYDEEYATIIGIPVRRMNYLMSILTAITIALGIRIVGTMLISSMIIFPAITALQVTKSFKMTLILAAVIAVLGVIMGVLTSFVFNLPTGATIVAINGLFFGISYLYRKTVIGG